MGSDFLSQKPRPIPRVSIHAPAWGATGDVHSIRRHVPVSIHAPAWGATMMESRKIRNHDVSIHAPAWGATCSICSSRMCYGSFNPRSRMGSDARGGAPVCCSALFQSTLPHGERHTPWRSASRLSMFQSTLPHGERRFHPLAGPLGVKVSIHAPAWGATLAALLRIDDAYVSIHAPAWGATDNGYTVSQSPKVSIHAPAWGATRPRVGRNPSI